MEHGHIKDEDISATSYFDLKSVGPHNARYVMLPGQSWALEVFLNFFNNKKRFFAFVIKLIWLGVGFLNMTGAEIGY